MSDAACVYVSHGVLRSLIIMNAPRVCWWSLGSRAALGPCKLRAATQGIHYDYLLAVGELCENDLGHESARARLVDL